MQTSTESCQRSMQASKNQRIPMSSLKLAVSPGVRGIVVGEIGTSQGPRLQVVWCRGCEVHCWPKGGLAAIQVCTLLAESPSLMVVRVTAGTELTHVSDLY